MSASQQRIELIARIFAETGVSRIFQLLLHCLVKYGAQRPLTIRLRDKWVEYDPTNWSDQMDMTVNVGLGTGNKDQQLLFLKEIAMAQVEAVKMGGMGLLVTPKNLYNTQAKIVEAVGFKNIEAFWTDPGEKMPQPQPDPKIQLEEKKAEIEAKTKEQDMALEQRKADQEYQHKERMAQLEFAIAQQEMELKRVQAQLDLQLGQQKAQFQMQTAEMDHAMKAEQAAQSHEMAMSHKAAVQEQDLKNRKSKANGDARDG
jgi:hypothetical protein